jgi:hypothetical protein
MNANIAYIGMRGKSIVSHTESSSFRNGTADIFLSINVALVLVLVLFELFLLVRNKLKKKDR